MNIRATGLLPVIGALALGACQTSPTPPSGYLSSYEGVASPGSSLRAVVRQRRDDTASDAVDRVFLQPAILAPGVGQDLSEGERVAVLGEVDRQICFEVSERFTVVPRPDDDAGIVRTSVVRIHPTGRIGSGVSAVANFFNPVPIINVRVPGSTGGLAVESELLAPRSRAQIAAITWGRNATAIGTDSPSLSRIGDALQMAEPMGDAVGDAFASPDREVREIPEPDPCSQHGPRSGSFGSAAAGLLTGLYIPDAGRTRPAQPEEPADRPAAETDGVD